MTLHIKLERVDGTEVVWEDDQEPLGLIAALSLGPSRRLARVATGPGLEEAAARTAAALGRHGFQVDLGAPRVEYRTLSPDLATTVMLEHSRHRPVMTVVDNGPSLDTTWIVRWEEG